MSIQVTVWNEFIHEVTKEEVRKIYPDGIHGAIKGFLETEEDIKVKTCILEQPEHGLTEEVLENTDVLIWWAHTAHDKVEDYIVERVYKKVLQGMGLIVLHSGHFAKIFTKLMGTSCTLKWGDNVKERIWCCLPGHPIAKDIPEYIELDQEEIYGEFFDIPQPDELVFLGWYKTGHVFRSGCTFHRGLGKVFYFQPGHETCPTYMNENIQKVIKNAVRWANPSKKIDKIECPRVDSLED